MARFGPLRARLVGADGAAIADQMVRWSCTGPSSMACVPDWGFNTWDTRTGGDGVASIRMTAYYGTGPISVTASYGGTQAVFPLIVGTPDPRLAVLDTDYYANFYPDLKAQFGDDGFALQHHWLSYGLTECRRSSATFSIRDYIDRYPDLKQRFANDCPGALDQWFALGQHEGRVPSP